MKTLENNNYLKFNKNFVKCQEEFKDGRKLKCYVINWSYVFPAVLSFICYLNGLTGDFVHDDIFAIKNNPDVHGKTDVWELLQNDFWGKSMRSNTSHKSYRPLTILTFRLNYICKGLEPFYFHVVNVALHVVVTTLVVYTCRNVLHQRKGCSILAGLLFAVHPVHTEAVSGIVGRADVLAGTFFLLSFISYAKCINVNDVRHRVMMYLSSLVLAAAAMLSKETGVTVLGVAVIYDAIETMEKFRREKKGGTFSGFITRVILNSAFAVLLLYFRIWIMDGTLPTFTRADNPASFEESVITRVLSYSYLVSLNLWILIAPVTLCYDWQHGSIPLVDTLLDARNLATISVASVLIYILASSILYFRKKEQYTMLISLALTAVPFLPASNLFFPVGFVLAERVLYIPSMGFCLCVSFGFFRLYDRMRYHRVHVTLLMGLLLLMMSLKTCSRNIVWQSREALFRSGVETLPHNAKTHYNYGNFLKDSSRFDEAIFHYKETLRLDCTHESAHNNLGTLLDDKLEAEIHFREALRLNPSHQSAHINLGNLLFKRGSRDEGLGHLQRAVEIEYRNPEALTSMAWCLIEIGNYTHAEQYLQKAIEVNPEYFETYTHYAALMGKTGKYRESAMYYKKAYELDTSQSVLLVHAAHSYKTLGDFKEAENLLKRAIDIRRDVSALEQLAVLYYGSGRTQESLALYEDIAQLNGNSTETIVRHAKIVAANGDMEKAEEMLTKALINKDNDIDVLMTLGKVKSNLKKHQEAIELLSTAIELTKSSDAEEILEELYNDRANNFKDLKIFDKAVLDYAMILRINPHHSTAHINCGAIYHINGSIEKARHHYKKALELNPDNEIVRQNMEKLERLQSQRDLGIG